MTSHVPGSGPCYILRTYSSAWKASLWVPSADAVAAGQADPSPVLRAGRGAAHQLGPWDLPAEASTLWAPYDPA